MTAHIEYIKNLTPKNSNIVIFVSNLSQLKNIDFLPNIDFYLKNDNFVNKISSNNFVKLSNIKSTNNLLLNITITLIKPNTSNCIEIGSLIYKNFQSNKINNPTFVFSKYLFNNNKLKISDIIFGFLQRSYSFNKYKSKISPTKNNLNIYIKGFKIFRELNYKLNLLHAINFSKDLVSEPANILNPITYSSKCEDLKKIGLKIKILKTSQLKKIGMRSLLGVSQGSSNEPRVVILEWNLKEYSKPTILVGKGVTFDSGGISLKPSSGMEEMITDMAGSAVVVGSMINAALNKSSHSLVGIIGLVENMPDGKSQRPGDIITSLSGQTIEVLNTDAEGRLIIADILTYVQSKYKVKQIIDFATLTGAIMIALGTHRAGIFSNNDNLSNKLENAGEKSGDRLWRLPLGSEYDEEINSSRADMKNIGSTRFGGSIQAAQFIKRFVKSNIPWAHIDIAGVSWSLKGNTNSNTNLHSPGATAFGVKLIDQFLKGK